MRMPRNTQRGAILIQVALMAAVLLGFAALTTDYGLLLLRQKTLQNGVDAAALAGGPELGDPKTELQARQQAYNYASANRIPLDSVVVKNGPKDLPRVMTVVSRDSVPTFFARVLDPRKKFGRVSASATVAAYPVTQAWRLRPWGVPIAFFNARGSGLYQLGERATLFVGAADNDNPDDRDKTFILPLVYGAADPANGPFTNYLRNCTEGYSESVSVTGRQYATSQLGDLAGIIAATTEGVKNGPNAILTQAEGGAYRDNTWENPGQSPRVVILPVINAGEQGEPMIIAFTAFYIEGMEDNRIIGRFIPYSLPYDGQNPGTLKQASYKYGLYTFHLIDPKLSKYKK